MTKYGNLSPADSDGVMAAVVAELDTDPGNADELTDRIFPKRRKGADRDSARAAVGQAFRELADRARNLPA